MTRKNKYQPQQTEFNIMFMNNSIVYTIDSFRIGVLINKTARFVLHYIL